MNVKEEISRIEIVKSATTGWQISVNRVAIGVNNDGEPFFAGTTTSVVYTVGNADDVAALVKGMLR